MKLGPYANSCLNLPMRAEKSYTLFQFLADILNVSAGVKSTVIDHTSHSFGEYVQDEGKFQVQYDSIPKRVSAEISLTKEAHPSFRKVKEDEYAKILLIVLSFRGNFPNLDNSKKADAHYREFRALLRCAELEDDIYSHDIRDATGVRDNISLLDKLENLHLVEKYMVDNKRKWKITEKGKKLTTKVDEFANIFKI